MTAPRRAVAWSGLVAWCGALALALPAATAAAQPRCTVAPTVPAHAWPDPLGRPVSLDARDIALGDALDRLAGAAGTGFAYSPDVISPAQRVCVVADRRPLGDVLVALLSSSRAAPSVVAGRVVLVPVRGAVGARQGDSVNLLERVVVRDEAAEARRARATGMDVIEGAELRRQSLSSLADILDAAVPGAWIWSGSPGSVVASYGGFRGATSFGATAPKIYLDGVEVANPLLVTQLNPDVVDRIEVIRGPQGGALYGSDAIGGVVNVLTRHDGTGASRPHLLLSASEGASQSAFGQGLIATNEQRLALRVGDDALSAGLSAQFGQGGAIFPLAQTRQASLAADARAVTPEAIWSFTARYSDHTAGAGQNPLLAGVAGAAQLSSFGATTAAPSPQSAREYTLGARVDLSPGGAWMHSVTIGVDGYALDHVVASEGLYTLAADSALLATQGTGTRSTFRATTTGHFAARGGLPATTVTLGLDESLLQLALPPGATAPTVAASPDQWDSNGGAFAQLAAAWDDALFVSAGMRVEHNDAFTGADRHPLLPMLGVATVHDFGVASLKLRAAYGRGIRPPSTSLRAQLAGQSVGATRPALDAESQSGTELGAELSLGRAASLQVTRFDQRATGLVQDVLVGVDTLASPSRDARRMRYQLQNVGEIGNHGWEAQASLTHDALSLRGTLTLVDSRVRALARGYLGDLQPGDLMLGVPTQTYGLSAGWTAADWSGTLTLRRASRWVNYDRLALARDYGAAGADSLVGARLRDYWTEYDGDTDVRVAGTHALRAGVELVLTGDNLLGHQVGEPDNATIRPGRTISVGLRAGF